MLLENWDIPPDNLKLLDKKLGGGQFGIVKQGLLTTGKGDPELVAVKTVKGTQLTSIDILSDPKIDLREETENLSP